MHFEQVEATDEGSRPSGSGERPPRAGGRGGARRAHLSGFRNRHHAARPARGGGGAAAPRTCPRTLGNHLSFTLVLCCSKCMTPSRLGPPSVRQIEERAPMKVKTLKKKILRLEKRLREGPGKLTKLKRKMAEAIKANSSQAAKKKAARAAKAKKPNARSKRGSKAAAKARRSQPR